MKIGTLCSPKLAFANYSPWVPRMHQACLDVVLQTFDPEFRGEDGGEAFS